MNKLEPNAPYISGTNLFTGEVSVEEVAQIQALEPALQERAATAASDGAPAPEDPAAAISAGAPQRLPIRKDLKRKVSGRYRSCRDFWELDLRVDVDGSRPMLRVSGDYYQNPGATVSYFGSFVVDSPSLSVSSSHVTIRGKATTTWTTSYDHVRVIVPRNTVFMPPASASVEWMTAAGQKGATYHCSFQSPYFRTVELEEDYEENVIPFASYDTGLLPSGGPGRKLVIAEAYGEAGIEMRTIGAANVIPTAEAGADVKWDNSELHAAMEKHFSLWQDAAQWKVWLFHANKHVIGPGLLGIMFDQQGRQRQGAATFYQSQAGDTPDRLRSQLYTCVHELGHCFNLFHSFHKVYMNPPMPNRLDALSWMNYPQNFPGGAAAFWSVFPFEFDDLEVIHLRHALRDNIILGGNPFGTGAALTGLEAFSTPVEDHSGLKLELRAPQSFSLGQPVVVEIKLSRTTDSARLVHCQLHPNYTFVQIAIQEPSGEVVVYEPPIEHCIQVETVTLDAERPAVYESAYIGYGKNGLYFSQPGRYQLRAIYNALDGSQVVSNKLVLRVRTPLTPEDEGVSDLFLGEQQGMLLYLLGSDSEALEEGNAALDQVLEVHPEHPLAVYAELVKGWNAARQFKSLDDGDRLRVRAPQYEQANRLLSAVVDDSVAGKGVDNITLNMTMRHLARVQDEAGDEAGAVATLDRMVDVFRDKDVPEHVLNFIHAQAAEVRESL